MVEVKQRIVPHLWFDKEAKEAAKYYTSLFPESKIKSTTTLHDTPSGDSEIVSFELSSYQFMAISAGPFFKLNPSISFILNFDPSIDKNAQNNLDSLWKKLSQSSTVFMPLDEYPFSKYYGWIIDKYGVSWQLILSNPEGEKRPFIIPSLLFVGDVYGKAEEAIDFYLSVFKNSRRGVYSRYPKGMEPDREGALMFADFMLENQWFVAMDSSQAHRLTFNEAISLMVLCNTQEEIDYYWEKLSAVPEAEQCGWLKDKYGVSWQVAPVVLYEMMMNGRREQIDRVTRSFLRMKKFDIAKLKAAYNDNNAAHSTT